MPHGPPRNLLKFGGNPDHVTLRLGLGLLLTFDVTPGRTVLRLGEGRVIPRNTRCVLAGACLIVIKADC